MSRLKRGFSRRQSTYPMPHPSDRRRQDFDFAGYRDRPIQSAPDSGVKRFVWRVMIESAVILGLLIGVVFLTYKLGYLWLFDSPDEAGTTLPSPQAPAPFGLAQSGRAAAVSHYMIQLSPALGIEQADQAQTRLEATYGALLGSLKVSLRAQQVQGGAPVYYVVAGPLFSPVTADDICGQIEDAGYGDSCSVLPQTAAPVGVAAAPTRPAQPAQPAAQPAAPPVATGASPEIVAMVQRRLREAGFRPGDIAGQMGPETSSAIRAYQISAGLEPTGQITSDLLDRLAAVPAAAQAEDRVSPSVRLPLDAATTPALQGQPVGVTGGGIGATTVPPLRSSNPLTARAQEFLRMGDFSSARLLYEQAFNQGDPTAASGIALTYDPVYYQEAGVVGMTPNPENAVTWYRRAIDAGDAGAVPRLERLIKWLQQRSASNDEARRVLQRLQ